MATQDKATSKRGAGKPKGAAETAQPAETAARRRRSVPPTTFRTPDGEALETAPDTHPIDGAPIGNGRMRAPTRRRTPKAGPVTVTRMERPAPPSPATKIAAGALLADGDESRYQWVDSNTVIIRNQPPQKVEKS
jgi:hypothetical protein